tara:strand:+ start:4006 stop:5580 length:1575 start_codon:yes stop_codon:yes gene_type:complete
MADWGLYSALRGTDDWATKRQDKQMNLLAAEKMEQRQQVKVAQSAAAEASIAKYMEELQNLETTPEDQERVAQAEKRARQSIVKGIANSNGDLRKYMSTGGITALNDYKTSVMQSEEVKQAGVNSVNLANYIKMEQKGNQRHKLIDVEVPMMGEDGSPVLDSQGNPQFQVEKMTMQDQYNKYKAGEITKLNYNGSETRVNLGIHSFGNQYKNSADIYQKDNFVTESNVYEKMLSEGASKEYAIEQAKRYGNMEKAGGDAWRWKAGDQTALKMKQQALSLQRRKQKFAEQQYGDELTKTRTSHLMPTAIKALAPGEEHILAPTEVDFWRESLQMKTSDERGSYIPGRTMVQDAGGARDENGDPYTYNIESADNILFKRVVARPGTDGKVHKFIEADITLPDPTPWYGVFSVGGDYDELPFEDRGGMTYLKDNDMYENWNDDGSGNYNGKVLIPIGKYMENETFNQAYDKAVGIDHNYDVNSGTLTDGVIYQQAQQALYTIRESGLEGTALTQALIDYQNRYGNLD